MLLYFKTRNNRSFADPVEFSMIATDDHETLPDNFVWIERYNVAVLKSAVFYGGNASGKTNLLKAMIEGVHIILKSSRNGEENIPYDYSKHRLGYDDRPVQYVYGLLIDNTHYEYSFSHNQHQILDEKLLRHLPDEKYPETVFQRFFNPLKKQFYTRLNGELQSRFPAVGDYALRNELLLARIAPLNRLNTPPFFINAIYDWFREQFQWDLLLGSMQEIVNILEITRREPKIKAGILDWLNQADTTISDILFEENKKDEGESELIVKTKHYGENPSASYSFFDEESTGTQQLIRWSVFWITAFLQDWTLLIDEFGNNLHPRLVDYMLKRFHAQSEQAQLIFTTHDTSILNSGLMRDDQIWFVNRDKKGNSTIEPFSDYDIPDDKLLNHVYLQGVLGGVPHIDRSREGVNAGF